MRKVGQTSMLAFVGDRKPIECLKPPHGDSINQIEWIWGHYNGYRYRKGLAIKCQGKDGYVKFSGGVCTHSTASRLLLLCFSYNVSFWDIIDFLNLSIWDEGFKNRVESFKRLENEYRIHSSLSPTFSRLYMLDLNSYHIVYSSIRIRINRTGQKRKKQWKNIGILCKWTAPLVSASKNIQSYEGHQQLLTSTTFLDSDSI